MFRPHLSRSHSFIRLICFAICCSLILPVSTLVPGPKVEATSRATLASPRKADAKRAPAARKATPPQNMRWRDNELLIRFKEHVPVQKMHALLASNGARWAGLLRGQSGIERLTLPPGSDPEALAARLGRSELVDLVEPNYLITADQTATGTSPNDPRFAEQWALKNTFAPQAWGKTTGSKRTVIAIIDSGVDFTHPDLSQNRWDNSLEQADNLDEDGDGFNDDLHGWDFVTNSNVIVDGLGHGTAVAGIIAAQGDNKTGGAGVMWQAGLMSLRVLDQTGTGDVASAVEAIDYATMNGAQVINCSWGTGDASKALREAISRAGQRGVLVVASAGNSSLDIEAAPRYPASFDLPNLIAVAATDSSDVLAAFSNWGAAHAAIAAPGKDVLTTGMGGEYQLVSGTSSSAAFVSGVAGLIKTMRPWLGAERAREMIMRGARAIPSLSDKVAAKGMVSARGSLEQMSTLGESEGLGENIDTNGGEHGDNGNGRRNQRDDRVGRGNSRSAVNNRDGKEFSVEPAAPTRGVPASGLPNLEELRGKQPSRPKAPDAVPSTRCAHHDARCARDRGQAAVHASTSLLAWGLNLPPTESISNNNPGFVSDSPFRLFWSQPALMAAPLPRPQTNRINVALASNGGTASASSTYSSAYPAGSVNNGDRKGVNWNNGGGWNDATASAYPDWLQIEFGGSKVIDEVDVFTLQDNPSSPVEPTEAMTFSLYGITAFDVQYWDGSAWATVPGGSVSGNNRVWRKFTFSAVTTSKVRILVNNALFNNSRIVEMEVWGTAAPLRSNVALSANGGTATASSTYSAAYPAGAAINGDRKGLNWNNGGGWNDATASAYPDWLQVDFNGTKTIDEIDVFTIQDSTTNPSEPTEAMTFTLYGITGFTVQYWDGAAWATVSGGSVTGNNRVWRTFTFAPLTTSKIRVLINNALFNNSRIIEVEAWGTSADSSGNDYAVARVDAGNRTGTGGVDLLSRNANWSIPVLSLPGRAGLDLGLSLSYNSLVWTKDSSSNSVKFDADRGSPAPGFRLGFPVIQSRYYNPQVGANAYLLLTPSGSRIELRQIGTNTYEAGDSSYLQLTEDEGGRLTLRPTDGSQLTYAPYNGQYQCTEIKDRNGNYISISYYGDGRINTVTDTLGRVITFNYDSYQNLKEITQSWTVNGQSVTHKWATFGWSNLTVQTSFSSSLTVLGPPNGSIIPVLESVGLADGTYYKFRYNSWGQVDKVTAYAADSQQNGQMLDTHPLHYTSYTMDAAAGQADCPRVTEARVAAEYWTGQEGIPSEVVTSYSTATDLSSGQAIMPDQTIYKELFATSGWRKGLTTSSEIWSGGEKKKWTTIDWTQSNTTLAYQQNPRVTETNVYDSDGNRRRTRIEYGPYAEWGLPYRVIEYAADGATEIRHTFTDYNLSTEYVSRRIIGLVSARHLSDTQSWQSIVYYSYDAGGDQLAGTPTATARHDNDNYGTGMKWRGNLTGVTRYNALEPNNVNDRAETKIGYNTNGSVVFTKDPLDHRSVISYDDYFSDDVNRNTFAYPTKVTPPLDEGETNAESFSTTTRYNYHFGAVTYTKGAVPLGYTMGPEQTFEYDAAGRILKVNNLFNGAYRRWVYDPKGHVFVYTLAKADGQETFSTTVFDGLGRVRGTGGDNPNSAGGYLGQLTRYDLMGRAFAQSNPAEMTQQWAAAGEDAAGWVWTTQQSDWKGRPTVKTNPDGTTKEVAYGGCGCAGGEVITIRDEVGRKQRMTADILGRPLRTEVLNTDGTIYSSVTNNYNARDQITSIIEQGGAGGASQTTTLQYDGHGRLWKRKAPAQTAPTVYLYTPEDAVQSVTDGRGATSNFSYNSRHLATGITYNAPGGIKPTATVTFIYDAAGNRTSMTDGSGSMTYEYDRLSRLTSETRRFSDLPGSYKLSYEYNLADELTSIKDPAGEQVNYAYDKAGRLTDVTGTEFAGVTGYASNVRYRAWGALKSLSYGNSKTLSIGYDNLLRATSYEVPGVLKKSYWYYDDGRLRFIQDQLTANSKFDRFYTYDHIGHVSTALSGAEARGQGTTDDRPYRETLTYDALNHLTMIDGRNWNEPSGTGPDAYVNDRNPAWTYDADGRILAGPTGYYSYDAAGEVSSFTDGNIYKTDQQMDGDGRRAKSVQRKYEEQTEQWVVESTTYYVSSSMLGGQVVTELNAQGGKQKTFVYAGGDVLATQVGSKDTQSVQWAHRDASGASFKMTDVAGQGAGDSAELDAMGANAGLFKPLVFEPPDREGKLLPYLGFEDINSPGGGCVLDRMPFPCDRLQNMMRAGAVQTEYPGLPLEGDRDKGSPGKGYPRFPRTREIKDHGLGLYEVWLPTWFRGGNEDNPRALSSTLVYLGHSPQNSVEVPLPDVATGIKDLLSNSTCNKFVTDLIKASATATNPAHSTDGLTLYGMISGIVFEQQVINGHVVGGTVSGSISGHNATINISPVRVSSLADAKVHQDAQLGYFLTGLHETIHHAGKNNYYSDAALAAAAFKLMSPERQAASPLPKKEDFANVWDFVTASSGYWNDELNKNCKLKRR